MIYKLVSISYLTNMQLKSWKSNLAETKDVRHTCASGKDKSSHCSSSYSEFSYLFIKLGS